MVLNKGRIEQVGTPYELYNAPANLFVATFIGSPKMNMLAATAAGGTVEIAGLGALPLPADKQADGKISIGVRPEQVTIGAGELRVEGTITLVEYLGSEVFLYVRVASGDTLLVQAPGQSQYKIHDAITLGINSKEAHYFNEKGLRVGLKVLPYPPRHSRESGNLRSAV